VKIIIEKNSDVKSMAKLKDFVAVLADMFPGQIDLREVIQIETSNRSLCELLNAYGKTPKPALICPRCGNMVKVLTKVGICKPCTMVETKAKKRDEAAEARRNLDADLLDIDNHPLSATKVG
jgi:hypothetical protein